NQGGKIDALGPDHGSEARQNGRENEVTVSTPHLRSILRPTPLDYQLMPWARNTLPADSLFQPADHQPLVAGQTRRLPPSQAVAAAFHGHQIALASRVPNGP